MPAMLPVPDDTVPRPAAILPSVSAALAGEANQLGLPAARSAIIVLVDGLGASNLSARAGHARHLVGRMSRRDVIRTVFPSTTAAAITSFATGEPPGVHGIVGYRVLEPESDRVVNQLNGWEAGLLPDGWQRSTTWFEHAGARDIRTVAVGAARYATSGFTRAVLRGAEYRAAATIADRVDAALDLISGAKPTIVYLYIPELDQLAHSHGWESERWLAALETVDAELARLDRRLPNGVGLLVTADHGVVDVPAHRHVFVDDRPDLLDGIRHIAGEPRCLALHLDASLPDSARERLIDGWRDAEAGRSWVLTRDEALDAGLYAPAGRIAPEVRGRIGDVLVAARAGIAYYDRREANRTAEKMIGQHGSWTDEESRVPLIRGGAFGRD
ncbi:alkaline phosphatase family protein [Agromyces larvae]|uniref:Alkaline phosphatase family protein n=1 Tax=Agromyces larvae TaxID=2929802 RepID=A0ABY4C0L7_9MICO|nr:nucleotide pyrophosphatase/phosphodiesterase family protein [Agromyces larvae]UOE45038.1 alkaline phosphatase family protein [Agromyces larvae]